MRKPYDVCMENTDSVISHLNEFDGLGSHLQEHDACNGDHG